MHKPLCILALIILVGPQLYAKFKHLQAQLSSQLNHLQIFAHQVRQVKFRRAARAALVVHQHQT